jgi:hypothetical protein
VGKSSGLGDNLYVGGYDLSGDTQQLSRIGGGPAVLDVTGINKSAYERIGGQRDGGISWTSFFNTAAGQAHPVLSALPTADVPITYCRGTALGNPAACMISKQPNYDGNRDQAGNFTFKLGAVANGYGLEWGVQGTAGVRADTTATNGTGVDLGTAVAAAGFGLQAYLQVFSVTGTSCTVKLQGSSDNGGSDAFADITGGGFTAATGITSQRIATATNLTLERYIRVVTSGTFTQCSFSVVIVPNLLAPTF